MARDARMTDPYRAMLRKDWKALKSYYTEHKDADSVDMTITHDTGLHIVVYSGDEKLLEELLNIVPPCTCRRQNGHGNTALHEAASTGNLKIAQLLLDYDEKERLVHADCLPVKPKLIEIKNFSGETALLRAAAFGKTKMVNYLFSKFENTADRADFAAILHVAVLGKHFGTALALLKLEDSLAEKIDENGMTCFQLLANMPSAFKSGVTMQPSMAILYWCLPNDHYEDDEDNDIAASQTSDLESGHGENSPGQSNSSIIFKVSVNGYGECKTPFEWKNFTVLPTVGRLWKTKAEHRKCLKLAEILAKKDFTWKGENGRTKETGKSDHGIDTPLIAAARHGIIEVVQTILELYPQAIEHVNKNDENIFHIAARYRRKEILDMLQYNSFIPISRLRRMINVYGDSILHQAAYWRDTQLRDRPGEALRMQSEIQWFKRVKKIVPTYFINRKNSKDMTAQELFTIEHNKLMEEGREWLRRTTQACTIVSILIATIAFTCAYTVPGGNSKKTGSPVLEKKVPFRVFAASDAASLCFALTSVVVFMSILTSRMHEKDFRISLPFKLVLGLTTLFFAVAAMMVSFAANLILSIRQKLHWAAIPIYAVACFPVTFFLLMQFPLYLNMAWFTVVDVLDAFVECLPFPKWVTKRASLFNDHD
ncbi:hypothetical protein ACFE04_030617 [Oxalis oulophora]